MTDSLITLTTDFGEDSPYVAAMKGVVMTINPAARVIDLSHQIPPQNLRHAAFFLAASLPYFPPAALHIIVVDPGVGTDRPLLYVEGNGLRLLVPDNGCWTTLPWGAAGPLVIRLEERRFWRPEVSATFHGRDILAPVAGHLSLGVDPHLLGPVATDWIRLSLPEASEGPKGWKGEVQFVDHFGNLITNIPAAALGVPPSPERIVVVGNRKLRGIRWVHSYAEAEPGALVGLVSSAGTVEVAVNQGSAARRLRASVGTPVRVARLPGEE
jgi:S-adenosylmethionine hydrolase